MLPVAAESWPSGPASAETHERLCRLVLDEVERGGFDAILLDLHGAMVAEGVEDAEGDLLRRLREIDPTTPVAVTLDMHANLYDDIVRHATVISGFHTYPHVDIHAAGLRAANVIVRTLKGEIKPVMRWGNKPMLPHVMRQGTHAEPNKSLQERCIALEAQGVLAASVFVGFPHADIREGLSAVVCTDGKAEQAEQLRDELLERAWNARADWVFHPEPLEAAITRAKAVTQGRWSCWTTTTTPARAAPWTPRRCWPRCCARAWTTPCSTPSAIRRPRAKRRRPASAARSASSWAARSPCPPSARPASRWRSPAA